MPSFSLLQRLLALGLGLFVAATGEAAPEHGHGQTGAFQRCISSAARSHELRASDSARTQRMASGAAVQLPAALHQVLARLLAPARLPAGLQVSLRGVAGGRSASVLASGTLFLGSRLWQGDAALSEAELAAALAHEIAHLEAADVRHRLCEAVASSGDETLPLAAATQASQRVIAAGRDDLAVQMMQRNHLRELRADRRGAELLAQAGFAPGAMATMLLKVTMDGHGAASGSHPAIETRLENLGVSLEQVVAGR